MILSLIGFLLYVLFKTSTYIFPQSRTVLESTSMTTTTNTISTTHVTTSSHAHQDCCSQVLLSASGAIEENQWLALFEYEQVGSFNDHPMYRGSRFNLVSDDTKDLYL